MGSVTGIKIKGKFGYRILRGIGLLFCVICLGVMGMTVRAEEQSFEIDAQMLPSDKDSLDVLVTVENRGPDWEGIVRLTGEGIYSCAYDTVLSLPQGSTKQFVVRIPRDSVNNTDGVVAVTLLDQKSDRTAKKEFRRLLQGNVTSISMGILSDKYTSLTYMDMGGGEYYYNGGNYPIKLVELDQDNLIQMLDALTFLVIDDYDTGVLSDAAVARMESWVESGGMLIVGTGSNAEDTLRGLAFSELQCDEIFDRGAEANKSSYDYYIDVSQLSWANLIDAGGLYEDTYMCAMLVCSRGSGAVGVLPYTLSELGHMEFSDSGTQEYVVQSMLDEVGEYASSRYASNSNGMGGKYNFRRAIRALGNGSERLSFGALRIIVILYVIFVGPVLYLILRLMKKRDLYWVTVPVSAVAAIFLVWFAGRGFEVVDARVYSVTIQDLSGGESAKTYMHCYDSGNKKWSLRLADRYEYAGSIQGSYYSYDDDVDHYVTKEGDRLSFGIKPSTNFQDCYFMAGGSAKAVSGSILSEIDTTMIGFGAPGIPPATVVTNGTDWDFTYLAFVVDSNVFVYKNVPAGETCELDSLEMIYEDRLDYYMYGCAGDRENRADMDVLTALGMGITAASGQKDDSSVAIVGIVENWDKAVDDACKEISYGCLYVIL